MRFENKPLLQDDPRIFQDITSTAVEVGLTKSMGWPLLSAESVCLHLLGFGTVDGSLMAVQNLGPTGIARLIQLTSATFF